jgi:hypothetical protein
MPDESCRNCGGNLKENMKCKECNKATRFECQNCFKKTHMQFHFICNIEKENPLEESIINNFSVISPVLIINGQKIQRKN